MNMNFNQEQSSTTTNIKTKGICATCSQFKVLSGGLIECLDEPWHVGVSLCTCLIPIVSQH